MTRGPGRHSERNFCAAEQHYNAGEWPTDAVIIIRRTAVAEIFADFEAQTAQ